MAGLRRIPPPCTFADPRDCRPDSTVEIAKAAKPNQRKAVEAWASLQRFSIFGEPFVTKLVRIYGLLLHECTPRYAAVAIAPQRKNMVLSKSRVTIISGWKAKESLIVAGIK